MKISTLRRHSRKSALGCARPARLVGQSLNSGGDFFRSLRRTAKEAADRALKATLAQVTDYLNFMPEKNLGAWPQQFGAACNDLQVVTSDGLKLHGWYVPALGKRQPQTVLHFHGNKGNLGDQAAFYALLARRGYAVFAVDYRGYGRSEGTPSELGFYRDGLAAYQTALGLSGGVSDQLVIWGTSLGGAVAIELASRVGHGALVAESTFTNTAEVLGCRLPQGLTLPPEYVVARFNSLSRIGSVATPKLFIHGDRDLVIPDTLGKKLAAAASQPKRFFSISGAGHTDLKAVAGEKLFLIFSDFLENFKKPNL